MQRNGIDYELNKFTYFRDHPSGNPAQDSNKNGNTRNSNATSSAGTGRPVQLRRSSVVVIPPIQVCPGDLLVYSKASTHGGNIGGT